jgi:RNA polymerase sigma-70 factor (ECF subfamily)
VAHRADILLKKRARTALFLCLFSQDRIMSTYAASTSELLERARRGNGEALGRLLELHRAGLHRLAARQLDGRVAVRVAASDVLQQTFLEAHRRFGQFAGREGREWAAWLRAILEHKVAGAIRDHALLQKRSVRREQSMDQEQGSKTDLKRRLDAGHSSPSQKAMRVEDRVRLERALGALPEDQREAVRLRHLEGWALEDIARRLNRTPAASAGLIKRGMQALRRRLQDEV